jgi:hypothetical protein
MVKKELTIQQKLAKAREKAKDKGVKKAKESLASTEKFIKSSGTKNKRLLLLVKEKKKRIRELQKLK